jgi:hypothetical protein
MGIELPFFENVPFAIEDEFDGVECGCGAGKAGSGARDHQVRALKKLVRTARSSPNKR